MCAVCSSNTLLATGDSTDAPAAVAGGRAHVVAIPDAAAGSPATRGAGAARHEPPGAALPPAIAAACAWYTSESTRAATSPMLRMRGDALVINDVDAPDGRAGDARSS